MALLEVELPWDSQPQEGFFTSPEWAIDGMWTPGAALSGPARLMPGVTTGVVPLGRIWNNSSGINAAVVCYESSAGLPLSEATVILGGWAPTAGTQGDFGVGSTTSAHRFGGHVPFTDNKVYFDFGGSTSGATRVVTSSTVTKAVTDVWAFTTGPRGMEIWQNGILLASNTATPTRTASTGEWGLGPQAGFTGIRPDGAWWLVAISRRQAARGALEQLRSPARAFAELIEPHRIYIQVASSGGSSFNPAWAIGSNAVLGAAGAHA